MQIRQANQGDSLSLTQLILFSAPKALAATFNVNQELSAANFLQFCLLAADGQYGYANHWVAELNQQVVGCISAWHSDFPNEFHLHTLKKLTEYYGVNHTISVLQSSQLLQSVIPKPKNHEFCIGHVAVLAQYQRQGVASRLLKFASEQALVCGKSNISLDVESTNLTAINFYLEQGFTEESESDISPRLTALGVDRYLHLSKALI